MKSTGMTRPLDQLGRIVLPKEMRVCMGIDVGDPLEIFLDSDNGMLAFRKYIGVSCRLCGSIEDLTYFRDTFICSNCIGDMKEGKVSDVSTFEDIRVSDREVRISRMEATKDSRRNSMLRPSNKGRLYKSGQMMREKLRQLISERPGCTQSEYARLLGISQSRVSQLLREI